MLKGADARLLGQKRPLKRIDIEQVIPLLIGKVLVALLFANGKKFIFIHGSAWVDGGFGIVQGLHLLPAKAHMLARHLPGIKILTKGLLSLLKYGGKAIHSGVSF